MIRTVTRCAHCGTLELEGLVVDPAARMIRWQDRAARVQRQQVDLLAALLEGDGRPRNFDALIMRLWGGAHEPDSAENIVKARMSQLRKTLRELGAPYAITNVYGLGYCLIAAPSREAGEAADDGALHSLTSNGKAA